MERRGERMSDERLGGDGAHRWGVMEELSGGAQWQQCREKVGGGDGACC